MDDDLPPPTRPEMGTAPNVRFPPPLVFLGFILLGLVADRFAGLPVMPIGPELAWTGFAAMMAGLALIIVSLGLFRAHGENPEPWTPSQAIIARGPYRHSRNPMYLGMLVIQIGYALWDRSMGVFFFVPIVFAVIDRGVIAKEEAYLAARFGAAYRDYCREVRRWL